MSKRAKWSIILFFSVLVGATLGCTIIDDLAAGLEELCATDPFVVTKTADTNDGLCTAEDCSLREAVVMANACPGHQTIQLPPDGYHLTRSGANEDAADTGDLDITDDLTINGIGAPSVHGEEEDRVFEIFEPAEVELNLLIIVEGREQLGAGIRNHSVLTVNDSAINFNEAVVPEGGVGLSAGGGLHNDQGAVANFNSVQFIENMADLGGGVHNFAVASFTMNGGQFAGNNAGQHGGALWNNFEADAELNDVNFFQSEAGGNGGAIYNDGHLEMSLNPFEQSIADGNGGGLYNGPDGEAFLYEAWFTNNNAELGGGVFNAGLLHLYQSGLNNNTAFGGFGGGAYNDGALAALLLQNTTVSANVIIPTGSAGGSGIYNGGGDLSINFVSMALNSDDGIYNDGGHGTIENTILASHSAGNCAGDPLSSNGYNLEDADDCGFTESSDLVDTMPLIAFLAMNGGNSLNHALLPGSPALDSATPDTCIPVDQRGVARPIGAQCDRGSYEGIGENPPQPGADDLTTEPTAVVTPTPTAVIWPPIDINFNADDYSIFFGECTRLRWEVLNAEQVYLDGVMMPALEAEEVCPETTTTYKLMASNPQEEAEEQLTIEVIEQPPAPPEKLANGASCSANGFQVTLMWDDIATNEDGYRVYRNGALIATLGANAESYVDSPPLGGPYTYGVEAYNASGASSRPTTTTTVCQVPQ
jgi:CSLREA domain-containing protein